MTSPSDQSDNYDEEAQIAEMLYENMLAARKRANAEGATPDAWNEFAQYLEELFEADFLIFKPHAAKQAFDKAKYTEEAMKKADVHALLDNVISVSESKMCYRIGYDIVQMTNPDFDEYMEAKERSIRGD